MRNYTALAALAARSQRRLKQIPNWTQAKFYKEEI